jgi:hypothetical protein
VRCHRANVPEREVTEHGSRREHLWMLARVVFASAKACSCVEQGSMLSLAKEDSFK